jgi:hypothetical protein
MGNPALFPLIYNCKSTGIVIVHISIRCSAKRWPHSAGDISNRINEIRFNSAARADSQHRGRRIHGCTQFDEQVQRRLGVSFFFATRGVDVRVTGSRKTSSNWASSCR